MVVGGGSEVGGPVEDSEAEVVAGVTRAQGGTSREVEVLSRLVGPLV